MTTTTVVDMDQLLKDSPDLILPKPGELIDGKVLSIGKAAIIIDLGGILTGIVAGREIKDAMNTANELNPGDDVTTCVLETENEDGLVVLSLRRASQEKTWDRFLKAYENDTSIEVVPKEANKGGLLLDLDGIKGFIPVSQLAPLNYPRVNGADTAKILSRLQLLIGKKFNVKILNIDKENGKLILSEKASYAEERYKSLSLLKIGDTVDAEISGIVKFGIFAAFKGLEGLVHISEIAWGHVGNARDFGKRGDSIKVKIIGIDGDKISLSMKQLTDDPWKDIQKKYKISKTVKTKIIRLAQFGAFVELEGDINGLIHNSEIPGAPNDPADVLAVGEEVKARVIEINENEKRIGLTLMPEGESPSENAAIAKAAAKADEAAKAE
ncbi:S1 RNA-binding domain-containing protein [Candidatus Peregrinibacteria bacterium]|jgi:small subunit ribosomal protein S1|nr:S1 RNA-binding domain-containing protein [Candidatus Peregrinibacteria bacterium]MBT4631951.1 S1 RNA-binding domain-containing protein [Candidatus Peregrinibacteria bacterium]MBT5517148.1 S1 RNA-binding domain-containing protein [Candidatus Peregrinibacteria bacterium]MBT5823661.1 S1 RNA-binding domain-containing protein [Candidatus Peregrinibacteria bacterium]